VSQLKSQLEKTDSEFDKEKLQERLGKLAGGVAMIKVGAPTESAQKELKQRVEDAVAATRAAMEEGIIPGGGIALLNVSLTLPKKEGQTVEAAARGILFHALQAPISAIATNSGESAKNVIHDLEVAKNKTPNAWMGFNASTNQMADLKEAGIIDPLKVTKTAFRSAISVAANYLMIGAAVTEIPEEKKSPEHMHGGGMGMGY
jgi:chaperonin GroEL